MSGLGDTQTDLCPSRALAYFSASVIYSSFDDNDHVG